jgi:hypothetical protein
MGSGKIQLNFISQEVIILLNHFIHIIINDYFSFQVILVYPGMLKMKKYIMLRDLVIAGVPQKYSVKNSLHSIGSFLLIKKKTYPLVEKVIIKKEKSTIHNI